MSPLPDPAAASGPRKIEFDDPHAQSGPLEAEVTRVRKLSGFWRWLLILATAATIFLCINQQFNLRFFVGYTQLNTEYFYLLIACMLPFTFLIFPATVSAPLDRVPWYDVALFLATAAAAAYLMASVRKAAELGWEFTGAPMPVIVAGVVMWVLLMEGLRRTGGWSLLLCVRALHGLSAVCRRSAGSGRCAASSRPSSRPPPITCCPMKACSAFRSRHSPTR